LSAALAILEHMFEHWYASRPTQESAALLERVRDAARTGAQAAARRLVAIGELYVLRCRDSGEREDWAMDTWEAVAAQVAAALQCSVAMGSRRDGLERAIVDVASLEHLSHLRQPVAHRHRVAQPRRPGSTCVLSPGWRRRSARSVRRRRWRAGI
jgi:hypothetical protein